MRVAVLRGGRSSEHDVSLRSGAAVAAGLREAGHEVVEVLIERQGRWLAEGGEEVSVRPAGGFLGCDAVFPALHGPGGEDGSIQGLLEVADVPYVGSDVESSALCLDKLAFKRVLAAAGLPQVGFCDAGEEGWREQAGSLGLPLWVKPARLGSSVGITKVSVARRARRRRRRGPPPRREGDRRGERARQGGGVLAARALRGDRLDAGRDRRPRRLVRLRGEVRAGRDGPARPGGHQRRGVRACARPRPRGLPALRLLGPRPLRLLRGRRGRPASTS